MVGVSLIHARILIHSWRFLHNVSSPLNFHKWVLAALSMTFVVVQLISWFSSVQRLNGNGWKVNPALLSVAWLAPDTQNDAPAFWPPLFKLSLQHYYQNQNWSLFLGYNFEVRLTKWWRAERLWVLFKWWKAFAPSDWFDWTWTCGTNSHSTANLNHLFYPPRYPDIPPQIRVRSNPTELVLFIAEKYYWTLLPDWKKATSNSL